MIETITLSNYRGHTDTTIPCERLTLLVGENASGKTSVLRAVSWVIQNSGERLPAEVLRRSASEATVLLSGKGPNGSFRHEATYRPSKSGELDIPDSAPDNSTAPRLRAVFLSLNAEELVSPSAPSSLVPELAPSGRGLAAVLAYIKLAETERFNRIVDHLRAVVPIVRGLGFTRVEVSETVPRLVRVEDRTVELQDTVKSIRDALVFDFVDAEKVPASLVSEGTLLSLGILTAVETLGGETGGVNVLLIDDIDRALHPRAQRELVARLRAVLAASPNTQIIATSHSPYLVDAMRADEVVLLGRNSEGVIVARRLDAFPDERLRQMLSTGELWMSEGEDWIAR